MWMIASVATSTPPLPSPKKKKKKKKKNCADNFLCFGQTNHPKRK
jgi:hypothetical protein